MIQWDSSQYLKFKSQRTQPAIDLAGRIGLDDPADILDLGCGPGHSTEILASRYPNAHILGIDNSPDMIKAAKAAYPSGEFRLCDASRELSSLGRTFDVVFSNACLQWIPDHPALLRNMMALLKPGGVLAVQVPMNQQEPIHKIINDLVTSPRWKDRFPSLRVFYTLSQGEYYDLLATLGTRFDLWQTTYFHQMPRHEAIMEWYRGTGLRPYLEMLAPADKTRFEQDVLAEVVRAYPLQANGDILFRFPRFFFTAVK